MDIPINKVLQQIQAETEKALQSSNPQEKREHITAIKALSELALQSRKGEQPSFQPTPMPTPPINYASAQAQSIPSVQPVKRNEPDANGDSLFDF